jgi:uncharacterized membrane protein
MHKTRKSYGNFVVRLAGEPPGRGRHRREKPERVSERINRPTCNRKIAAEAAERARIRQINHSCSTFQFDPMSKTPPATLICQICKKTASPHDGMIGELIRPSLAEFIKKRVPEWDDKGLICLEDLGKFRKEYVKDVLEDELGELSALDNEVIESLHQHEILSSDINKQFERKLTFGEWLSDRIASFGGSWRFIILFGVVLVFWIILNAALLVNRGFDPYPFILLNLILSCLAAMQAPIIMMSQNRAELRDRLRSENDYKINLKAELEIRHLHEKIDHLLRRQYNRLFEIQQIQIELLEEIGRKSKD